MRYMTIKDYMTLPFNDPEKRELGQLFISSRNSTIEREPMIGEQMCVMEVIKLTDRGHESKMTWVRITK